MSHCKLYNAHPKDDEMSKKLASAEAKNKDLQEKIKQLENILEEHKSKNSSEDQTADKAAETVVPEGDESADSNDQDHNAGADDEDSNTT